MWLQLLDGYWGACRPDGRYNGSKTRRKIEERGGKSLLFADLADRVGDELYSKRMSIKRALDEMPIGNRAELKRWLAQVDAILKAVAVDA